MKQFMLGLTLGLLFAAGSTSAWHQIGHTSMSDNTERFEQQMERQNQEQFRTEQRLRQQTEDFRNIPKQQLQANPC